MKRYKKYMDGVRASDTLHQRLRGLETPAKRPVPWKKYGTAAAALVLAAGVGVGGLSGGFPFAANRDLPRKETVAASDIIGQPDIAPEDPASLTQPGEKALGSYDVTIGSGENAVAAHYILPYIDYGNTGSAAAAIMALDWDIPANAYRRDLDQAEIAALMGGEDVLSAHLDWSGYELTGWGAWYEDGSFWGVYLQGHDGPLDHFEFIVTADQLPPTCIGYPTSVTQEVRGLTITADGYDGKDGCSRRVSFMKGGYGYRFDLTATGTEQAELLASRLVCRVADEGLALWSVDPSVETYTCPDCGQTFQVDDMRAHIHSFRNESAPAVSAEPYDPREAADPSYNAPAVSAEPGYTCPTCGEMVPAGMAHDCAMCGLPLAPDTHVCEVCGQTLPAGVEHSHQQEHHQEEHHSEHH